jgi:FAD-dependent oxidoreductase
MGPSVYGLEARGAQKKNFVPNYAGSVVCEASQAMIATSVQEIQTAVKLALSTKQSLKVRSIKESRSYSPVICPENGGIVLNVEPLNKILTVDSDALTATVQPGAIIGDIQRDLNLKGLAFPVTPDYNGVTIAGAMGTGAHNSSLQIPSSVSDWIEEIKLVDGQGKLRTLTGEALDAARVHLGMLGVIYELKIKVVPQFKLQYESQKHSDKRIEFEALDLARSHAYAKISWFPTHKTYFLDTFKKLPLSTPGESFNNSWSVPAIAGIIKNFPQPIEVVNSNKLVQCSVEGLRVSTWSPPYKVISSSQSTPVGFSHQMISGSCPEGTCSWDRGIKTRTVEVAFAAKDFEAWASDVKAMLKLRSACFPLMGIYLRFSAPSKAYLGQAYGQETVMFEIHIPTSNRPQLEASSEVYDEIVQMTLGKYKGRPHWAKNSQPYFQDLGTAQYPQWEDFKEVRRAFDPQGIFLNPFWKKIESVVESTPKEGCGLSRECLCQVDSDCGPGARCETGVFFTEARLCVKR